MSVDYKKTVFLPSTPFPMKGELPKREPELLARWRRLDLYRRLRAQAKGREKFVLHDGPPFANGHLHIGHALNKILKDVINRAQQMLGKDANYVPGWDCHGLPIEWKIEEEYRAKGRDKDKVPVAEFRRECRDFADKWIAVQRDEFRRLGVEGDWDHPYLTMSYAAEAQIVRELGKFAMNGGMFRGAKPVMWSVVEKTALAEAEIEYHDHTSTTVYASFPVVKASLPELDGAAIAIWTTTPWTLPGNRAIAVGAEIDYVVLHVQEVKGGSFARIGDRLVVASALSDGFCSACGIVPRGTIGPFKGAALVGTVCAHPLRGHGYDFDVPVHAGGFVTTEAGTGFVHIAPGHGEDDWELGVKHGIEVPQTVGDDGGYYPHVPLFAGKRVYTPWGKAGDANAAVIAALKQARMLLAEGKLVHSYPHSWRSKAPLIFRNTPQWFISMATNGLRDKALAAIDATRWVPEAGRNRIRAMIETRPDWCISRQRAWGVPIAVFVDKASGLLLRDQEVIDRIAAAFEHEGANAWYESDPARFLGNKYKTADYEQVFDIVDVWFDSGATHGFVLETRADLKWPASLYLEGSDQHRGWFHSSLLESCGTRGRAPYDAVLTHGFVLDEQGRKMSKSLGNVVAPQEVVGKLGADILRLWVVSSDYSEDLRLGPEILKHQAELYRRLRNTLRYVLGGLAGFAEAERLAPGEMPELERWVLHRMWELDALLRQTVADKGSTNYFRFTAFYTALHNFCAGDLSAFYFDVRKDALYCDRPDSRRRRAARTLLDLLFSYLTAWLAPVLCFTAEEAWLTRFPGDHDSVHLREFPAAPAGWRDDALAAKWQTIRELRRVVTGALEIARAEKKIGAILQAAPVVYADAQYRAVFATGDAAAALELAEIAITSGGRFDLGAPPVDGFVLADVPGVWVKVELADGAKCQRCWRVLPEIGATPKHPDLCRRCADAVDHHAAAVA
ncbi:MAG: isoleucine--tRNA ligase [Proteobacteria bacterium]|nr:isoleucine--tRNA ligase [Pseudomonadota bacterium]